MFQCHADGLGRPSQRLASEARRYRGLADCRGDPGGIDTRDLSSKTFEVQGLPQLRFIGEVLDVTGELGGYNFQWAWASGVACGQAV